MAGTDLVGLQIVEVELRGAESDGLALHRHLARLCADAVTPELARTLARLGPPDGRLVVDRLEIDLGTLSWAELARELPALVAREVAAFLGRFPASSLAAAGSPDNVRYRSHRQATGEALLTFLRTGRLPWSYRVPAGRHLADEVLAAWTPAGGREAAPGAGLRAELIAVLAAEVPRRRLIQQFPPSLRRTLLRLLSAPAAATVDSCLDVAGPEPAALGARPADAPGRLQASIWDVAFAGLAAGGAIPGPAELVTVAWRSVPVTASGHTELGDRLRDRFGEIEPPARRVPGPVGLSPPGNRPGGPARSPGSTPPNGTARSPQDTSPDATAPDEGAYVTNAGVVLLHPFLPRFFEALGVADGERLRQPERALGLLHHLATGQVTAPEYDLTVAKVLCEVPAEEPTAVVVLGDDEIAEADALLRAAIRHWDALRGTGPAGLRETFLTRPGKLLDRDGDRLLRVEAESFDILLDQLPWGMSMIRLPWMSRLLLVEWR